MSFSINTKRFFFKFPFRLNIQKQIILFASIFAVICASKEQMNDGTMVGVESAIANNHIYSQPIQDNIAAESEVAKRGAAVTTSTSTSSSSDNQEQRSQIDVGKWHAFYLYYNL